MRFFGFNAYYGNTASKSFNTMGPGFHTLSDNTRIRLKGPDHSVSYGSVYQNSYVTKKFVESINIATSRNIEVLDKYGFQTVTVEKTFFTAVNYTVNFEIQITCSFDPLVNPTPTEAAVWLGFTDSNPGSISPEAVIGTPFRVTATGNTNPIWSTIDPPYLLYADITNDVIFPPPTFAPVYAIKFLVRHLENIPPNFIGTQRYVLSGLLRSKLY